MHARLSSCAEEQAATPHTGPADGRREEQPRAAHDRAEVLGIATGGGADRLQLGGGFITSEGLFLSKLCAAAVVVSLPVLIAGFAAQDKLVQGLSFGAVKG